MEPKIVVVEEFSVVGMEYHSSDTSTSIPEVWAQFIPRENEIEHKANPTVSYGLCQSLPNGIFTYVCGLEVSSLKNLPAGMVHTTVPTQKYAVFTHVGPVSKLQETMEQIYGTWLPENHLQPTEGIDFELYGERFIAPDDEKSEVDLYIPIK